MLPTGQVSTGQKMAQKDASKDGANNLKQRPDNNKYLPKAAGLRLVSCGHKGEKGALIGRLCDVKSLLICGGISL